MRLYPVFLDAQPSFLRGAAEPATLLTMLVGADSVLGHLRATVGALTPLPTTVVSPPAVDGDRYRTTLNATCPGIARVCAPTQFADMVAELDMSDALLIVDARLLPTRLAELGRLVERYAREPRVVHHLVASDAGAGGTRERVSFDGGGQIRGIQRHYEPETWPFISGVAATVLPVASAVVGGRLVPLGLARLREEIAARGLPTRDMASEFGVFRLERVSGVLAANEQFVLAAATPANDVPVLLGDGHVIDRTARLIGAVVLHAGARVDAHATIIGPTVVGPRAHIGAGAMVAHTAVGAAAQVAPGQVAQDAVWFGGGVATTDSAADGGHQPASIGDSLVRHSVHTHGARDDGRHVASRYLRWKRILDAIVAAVSLALLSPLISVVAGLIWLQRDGAIFYGDEREGVGGRVFKCWKFRTMSSNADAAQVQLRAAAQVDGPHFKMTHDPRVTAIGRHLRASNLDELPQLFNVLVGEMSFVGPRPSPFRENQICVPWRNARISVRPGITGLWQVCRHDRDAGDFDQWIEYDLLYVRQISALVDLKILTATILTLGGKATHVRPALLVATSHAGQSAQSGGVADAGTAAA